MQNLIIGLIIIAAAVILWRGGGGRLAMCIVAAAAVLVAVWGDLVGTGVNLLEAGANMVARLGGSL